MASEVSPLVQKLIEVTVRLSSLIDPSDPGYIREYLFAGEWALALTSIIPMLDRLGIAAPPEDLRQVREWITDTPMFARLHRSVPAMLEAIDRMLASAATPTA